MAARTKTLLVETVHDYKLGLKVEIFFHRDEQDFFAKVFEIVHRDKECGKLKKRVEELMRAAGSPEWTDVIDVKETGPFALKNGHYFGFEITRQHVWKRPDGHVMWTRWAPHKTAEEKLNDAHVSYDVCKGDVLCGEYKPRNDDNVDCYFRVPYDEELWVALQGVQQKLLDLKGAFRQLVTSDAGRKRLVAGAGMLLLGAPKSGDDDE